MIDPDVLFRIADEIEMNAINLGYLDETDIDEAEEYGQIFQRLADDLRAVAADGNKPEKEGNSND